MASTFDKKTLINILHDFDVPDPEYWADQELNDKNWAFLAAFRFLRPLQDDLDAYLYRPENWIEDQLKYRHSKYRHILQSMLNAGISPKEIGVFAYWIARMTYNSVLLRLSDPAGADYDLENEGEGLPRWALSEIFRDVTTGRYIPDLHTLFPYRNPEGESKS
jgi:hypothetical protein